MKIVQIGTYPLDTASIKGGIEASIYGLTTELAKTNQLFVIDIPRREIKKDFFEDIYGTSVFRFYAKGKNNYAAILRIKTILNIIRSLKPDICHIHSTSAFSFFNFILLKLFGVPSVVTIHGLVHIEKRNLWEKQHSSRNLFKYIIHSQTEFLFLSFCSRIIVDTQYVADTIRIYKKQGKLFRMPFCKVIPQGVNPAFFELNSTPIQHQLLSVGGFTKRKGHLQLIEAMKKVQVRYPDFSLIIAGVSSDKNYLQLMQNSRIEKGLEQNIRIYPDATFEQILTFYQNASVFILHSEEESQGIVFCEAMAAGKAIVATNVGGIPWVIENNVNGLLSVFGDIDAFADHVIKLLTDDPLRKKMEEINRMLAYKYDWESITAKIMELYRSLI